MFNSNSGIMDLAKNLGMDWDTRRNREPVTPKEKRQNHPERKYKAKRKIRNKIARRSRRVNRMRS